MSVLTGNSVSKEPLWFAHQHWGIPLLCTIARNLVVGVFLFSLPLPGLQQTMQGLVSCPAGFPDRCEKALGVSVFFHLYLEHLQGFPALFFP